VRNEAAFIAATLRQLLDQDYPRDRFEVLVADGESDDDTPRIEGMNPVPMLDMNTPGVICPSSRVETTPAEVNCSPDIAETDIGTSNRRSERFCAVTTTSSSVGSPSVLVSAANTPLQTSRVATATLSGPRLTSRDAKPIPNMHRNVLCAHICFSAWISS